MIIPQKQNHTFSLSFKTDNNRNALFPQAVRFYCFKPCERLIFDIVRGMLPSYGNEDEKRGESPCGNTGKQQHNFT